MQISKVIFAAALVGGLAHARVEYIARGKHRLYGELQQHGRRTLFVLNPDTRSAFEIELTGAPARAVAKRSGSVAELAVTIARECGFGCRIDREYSVKALISRERLRSYSGVLRSLR